ncbi:hypothetical protein IWX50DRAFT_689177, partial [Phyllosticta citricarpa]
SRKATINNNYLQPKVTTVQPPNLALNPPLSVLSSRPKMTTIAYEGMHDNDGGGWTTRYNVDVDTDDTLLINPDLNGPHAGHYERIVSMLFHNRTARTYGQIPRSTRRAAHRSIVSTRRPRTIRIFRARGPYQRNSGVPRHLEVLPVAGLPQWALDLCEVTELRINYWGPHAQLRTSSRPVEIWVPYRRNMIDHVFWFNYVPADGTYGAGSDGTNGLGATRDVGVNIL